jgi:hypothetical protein
MLFLLSGTLFPSPGHTKHSGPEWKQPYVLVSPRQVLLLPARLVCPCTGFEPELGCHMGESERRRANACPQLQPGWKPTWQAR